MPRLFKNILEVTLAKGGGACNNGGIATTMVTYLFVWTSEMRSSNQGSEHKYDIWRTVSFLPTLAPANCV